MFTAIYNDKNVLFLNTDNTNYLAKKYPFGLDIPEILLRKEIVNFDGCCTGDDILKVLQDDKIWKEQKKLENPYVNDFLRLLKNLLLKK